jgi:uncharacterized protein DUF4314
MKERKKGGVLSNLIGRRVRLLHTDDPYTSLKYGSIGTITDITFTRYGDTQVWCNWDDGSRMALLADKDLFEFVEE